MGGPMAEHIHRAGFALTVSDPDPAVRQRFDAMGIATCVALADIQSVDAALVIVGTDEQMHGVARGLRAAAAPPRYLVIMSTTAPAEIAAIERQFADCGTHVVDAPISGAVMAARRAELTVLVGAAKDDFDALQPVFAAVGSAIVHCGKTGAGQMTKVVNNIIAISNQYVAAEAYRLAIEHGLELDRLLPALDLGSGRNFLSRRGGDGMREAYRAWSETPEDYRAINACSKKDLDLAISLFPDGVRHDAVLAIRSVLETAREPARANWQRVSRSGRDDRT